MQKTFQRVLAMVAAVPLCLGVQSAGGQISAEEAGTDTGRSTVWESSGYSAYIRGYADTPLAVEDVAVSGSSFAQEESSGAVIQQEYNGRTDVLVWESGQGSVGWRITVPAKALYEIRLTYCLPSGGAEPEPGIRLDGQYPFEEFEKVIFPRAWKNAVQEFQTDAQGNQLSPEQTETGEFLTADAADYTGVTVEPFTVCLSEGEHWLELVEPGQPLVIAEVALAAPERADFYVTPEDIRTDVYEPIVIEGEDAAVKSNSAMVPKADTNDAGMSPADAYYTRINYIGGTSWQSPRETLTWSFRVKTAGYYRLGFRYKQNAVINGESWRWLKIDGETPFKEAKTLRFPYDPQWSFYEFSAEDGQPYYLWLDAGEHELSLEVTLGEMAVYYERLSRIVQQLGDEYIEIVKITGGTPDYNRDYELFRQIPDFNETLAACSDALATLVQDMQDFTGKRGNQYIAAMNNMKRVLDIMVERPYTAQHYVKDYYNNYSSLSSWLYDMKSMPLSIDWIQLVQAGGEYEKTDTGFLASLLFGAQRLFYSFTRDYALTGTAESGEQLRLWVNWGRDQATALNALIQDSFTPKTGISVQVELVNTSLVNGILSGNYPDMALMMTRSEPVNLGMRGALYDLSQFPDYEDVLERFQAGADVPYWYNGHLYALPDTQNFYILFYRKDVLDSLGLEVPSTWDEFLQTATIIQRNNMEVYVPYTQITTTTTVNSGIGSLNLFPTMMGQRGLSLYNEEQTATALNTPQAQQTFEDWTSFYLEYEYLKEADFYNRFRVGTMPLGIAAYSVYLTLYDAAPEIKGRWSVANVPGTTGGNNTVAGFGTGCAIVEKSAHHEEAWEFLKWWTSAETQTRYARNVESALGMLGRPQTSNVEAFRSLVWGTGDLEKLLNQWESVREIPEIPGSYYLTRAVDQAYWAVINGDSNVKDALVKWSRVADREIQRKIDEYSGQGG